MAEELKEVVAHDFTKGFDFGEAIDALKDGKKVARAGWNGEYVVRLFLDASSVHIIKEDADGITELWNPSQTDVLATDWQITN